MENSKSLTIHKVSQHGDTTILEGNRKTILNKLRIEARRKRRSSRQAHKLADNVHSIPESSHQSKLVTMASFELENCRMEMLLELLNNHGITKYISK